MRKNPISTPDTSSAPASSGRELGENHFDFRQLPVRATKHGTLELDIERFVNSSVFDEVYAGLYKQFVQPGTQHGDASNEQ
jgi:hypothetical protein